MNKSSSGGVKLSTAIFAVIVLAISALLSNSSVADDMDVKIEKSEQ